MSTAVRPVAPRPVAFAPGLLFEPRRAWLYIPVAVALSLVGALFLSTVAEWMFPDLKGPEFGADGWLFLFMVAVFAPAVETAIMAAAIEALRRFFPPWATIGLSAAGWGLAHSSAAPAWGVVIWWPFTIFSLAYLVWRQRAWWVGYLVAASIHAIQNAVPAIPLAFS